MLIMVLIGATLTERFHFHVNPGPLVGLKGILIGFCIYFVPGVGGAWLAVNLVSRIKRRFQLSSPRA
jgi:hypothetical protein